MTALEQIEHMRLVTDDELDMMVRRKVAVERCDLHYARRAIFLKGVLAGAMITIALVAFEWWIVG